MLPSTPAPEKRAVEEDEQLHVIWTQGERWPWESSVQLRLRDGVCLPDNGVCVMGRGQKWWELVSRGGSP